MPCATVPSREHGRSTSSSGPSTRRRPGALLACEGRHVLGVALQRVPVDRSPVAPREGNDQESQDDYRVPVGRLSVPHEDRGFRVELALILLDEAELAVRLEHGPGAPEASDAICCIRAAAATSSCGQSMSPQVLLDDITVLDDDRRHTFEYGPAIPGSAKLQVRGDDRRARRTSRLRVSDPVTEKSFCVTPCCTRSPIDHEQDEVERLQRTSARGGQTARVSSRMKRYRTIARRTMSISRERSVTSRSIESQRGYRRRRVRHPASGCRHSSGSPGSGGKKR